MFYIYKPPPSVPSAAEQSPEATSAAGPEDDPPVYLSGACGFLVVLQQGTIYEYLTRF